MRVHRALTGTLEGNRLFSYVFPPFDEGPVAG